MKLSISDYTLEEFLLMTVEVVYRNGERLYRVLVPGEGNYVGSRTLSRGAKEELYNKVTV